MRLVSHGPGMRRGRSRQGFRSLLLALAVLAASAGGAAVAVSASGSSSPASLPPAGDPNVAAQLSVFDRAATSGDALPAGYGGDLQTGYGDQAPSTADARAVTADDGQSAYLVPDSDGVCVVNTNETFCTPASKLAGAAVADLCSPTLPLGELELEWLLPDGSTKVSLEMSDRSTRAFASRFNVYIARLPYTTSSPLPTTINWTDGSGVQQSVPTPIPPLAQGQSCMHPNGQVSP
jgi:hypothetical protein